MTTRHAARLRAELVRMLYASSTIALITTPLASLTLAIIGWGRAPAALVLPWLAYVIVVAVARARVVLHFRRVPAETLDVETWSRRFVIGAAAAGAGWGTAALIFFSASAPWQMFLALVLAGVAMAAVPVLAPVMAAVVAYTIPTLVPITARFLVAGGSTGLAVAALGVVFGVGLVVSAWRTHQAIVRTLVLAFENRDLVEELRRARDELEARVRERTEALRTLIEASPLAIVELDVHGRVKTWNRAATALLGWTASEVLDKPSTMLPEEAECAQVETRLERKDGTLADVVLSLAPLVGADGEPRGTMAVIADIAERKRLELELRQSQKMEAVGRLAGGIAHDFNNLLTVIIGRGDAALGSLEPTDPTRLDVELIVATAERAATLTRQLLAFSRRQLLQPRVVPLQDIVTTVVPMLRRLIGEDIEIHTVTGPTPARVRVDPAQIEQVIMNLALNARDAMPGGGLLMISTSAMELSEAQARRIGTIDAGRCAVLSVSDTGAGMDEDTRVRVFEPFFTTKPLGKGTGLGLSMVYGIVEQHGGTITVESAPGRGSTFRIYLPLIETAPSDADGAAHSAGAASGSETVLLVEDEDEVRDLVARMLQRAGYTVLAAADPRAALELSARHAGAIDMLLTDVVMPEMSGRELRDRLAVTRPSTKVVYMSGYTDEALGRHGVLDPDVVLLQKPFRFNELAQKVREVLDS